MTLLLSLIRTARIRLALALCASLGGGFASAALLALINQALSASRTALPALGLRFLGIALLVLASRALSGVFFVTLAQRAKAELRNRLSRAIASAPYLQLERQGSGEGIAVLTHDMDAVVNLFVAIPTLTMDASVLLGCLVHLGWLSPWVLALALLAIALGSIGFHLTHTRALTDLRGSRAQEELLIRHFSGLFAGAKELRLHRGRKRAYLDQVLARDIELVRKQRTRGYVLATLTIVWGNSVFLAFVGIILFLLDRLITPDGHVVASYALTFLYMILPLGALLSALPNVLAARIALERIERLTYKLAADEHELAAEEHERAADASAFATIRLSEVSHRYRGEREHSEFTLGPLDLEFRPGELVFLIGGNGSGKTTLAKILVGLYPPERGQILLDGTPITDERYPQYRQHFSAVFSDFFLFESLIGLPVEDLDARARALLNQLQLSHKIKIDGGRFSTTELSLGQKKRLALLVAYLEDRPFYVFDEWAADQDPTFRQVFYRQLLPELKARGKAVLVITHDDRYFGLADRCIELDYGQLVDGRRAHPHHAHEAPLPQAVGSHEPN